MRLANGTEIKAGAFLFDMDGTIVDSSAVVNYVWGKWAERMSLDPVEVVRAAQGRRALDTITLFCQPGFDVLEETRMVQQQETDMLDGIVAIPGSIEMIRALPRDRWAVVTSAERPLALARLSAAGLPIPDVLITSEDVAKGKPDPQGYLMGAGALGTAPERCIVFEDAPAGIMAGINAKSRVVAIAHDRYSVLEDNQDWIDDYTDYTFVIE